MDLTIRPSCFYSFSKIATSKRNKKALHHTSIFSWRADDLS